MYSVKLEDVIKEIAKCLKLSITKTEQMISDIENDNAGRWMDLIYEKCDDNLVARFKVAANIIDEPDENDGEYDDYPYEMKSLDDDKVYNYSDNKHQEINYEYKNGYILYETYELGDLIIDLVRFAHKISVN